MEHSTNTNHFHPNSRMFQFRVRQCSGGFGHGSFYFDYRFQHNHETHRQLPLSLCSVDRRHWVHISSDHQKETGNHEENNSLEGGSVLQYVENCMENLSHGCWLKRSHLMVSGTIQDVNIRSHDNMK